MDLNKTLAEIAITGIFEGLRTEAKIIIDALDDEPISEVSRISLRALLLMSEHKYEAAVEVLESWCEHHQGSLDTPHAFYALAKWRAGHDEQAKQLCKQLLANCEDDSACSLANDILLEIGD